MLILLSPAKKLSTATHRCITNATEPYFKEQCASLVRHLKGLSVPQIADLMSLSPKLAELNFDRYQQFNTENYGQDNANIALYQFKGDVYQAMQAEDFNLEQLQYANEHLRILSGLYGVLRPLDWMQDYRLEMGTTLANEKGTNLYDFWQAPLTQAIDKNANGQPIINLASNEYAKAINVKALKSPWIDVQFKQNRDGKLRTIGLLAKRARGIMARYIIQNQLQDSNDLLDFKETGYRYDATLSTDKTWVFCSNNT